MTRHKNRTRARAIAYPARHPGREALLAVLAGFAFLAAAMLVAAPAHGQILGSTPYVPAPDPAVEQLRNRLNAQEADLKTAIDRSERLAFELAQSRKATEEANANLKAAQAENETLKARVEELEAASNGGGGDRAELTSARGAQAAEATAGLAPNAPAQGADAGALAQDADGLLKDAKRLLLEANYAGAEQAATAYLAKYSKNESAHEAQYTLAESLLLQENYTEAATAYGKLLKSYPKSPNAPTALVKLARSMRLMGKPAESCKTLDLLAKQYPKAPSTTKTLADTERGYAKCKAS